MFLISSSILIYLEPFTFPCTIYGTGRRDGYGWKSRGTCTRPVGLTSLWLAVNASPSVRSGPIAGLRDSAVWRGRQARNSLSRLIERTFAETKQSDDTVQ